MNNKLSTANPAYNGVSIWNKKINHFKRYFLKDYIKIQGRFSPSKITSLMASRQTFCLWKYINKEVTLTFKLLIGLDEVSILREDSF